MNKKITVLSGDGVGPEIINEAIKVIDKISEKYGHNFKFTYVDIGGCSIDKHGVPITESGLKACGEADAVLLGAVGGPKWDAPEYKVRPEQALLAVRKELGVFANLRPTKLYPQLVEASPLKKEITDKGIDFVIIRELTSGIYFGKRKTEVINGEKVSTDEMLYSEYEIERIGRIAFETARKRRKIITSVDKANVLDTSKLWREVMHRLAREYPDVEYRDVLVDNAALQIVANPSQFDVIVTENMFGDILSDEASALTGSIGMIPSASLTEGSFGLYEPIHGSAPDIAGKNIANPIATILSAAMMLSYSFNMESEAESIRKALSGVLDKGYRTKDIYTEGRKLVSCSEMGSLIASNIQRIDL